MLEHKLALGVEVVEGYTLGEVAEHNMVEDRSSYSGECRSVDREEEVVLEGRGSRVIREVPLVP